MRATFLITVATLTLAACGDDQQTANAVVENDAQAAERIVANDVTAIDAVTADAANMAAEVNYLEASNLAEEADGGNRSAATSRRAPAGSAPRSRVRPDAEPAPAEAEPEAASNAAE